jgi:DNA repair protein RadD
MLIPLRGYQENAKQRARELVSSGITRVVLVSPMGSGKTVLAASIIYSALERGNRTLFVADQRELIRQCFCKLVRAGIAPHDIGIIMANTPTAGSGALFDPLDPQLSDRDLWRMFGRTRPGAPVQIASIDTYKNRAKPPADIVIVDECHEGISKSHMAMFANYPDAIFIGLTATPYRSDGRGLGEFWHHLEVVTTTSALMATGDLVDPIVWTVPLDRLPDLANVRVKSNGDFDEDELAVAMDKPELVGDIVDHWYRRASGIRTVAFAAGVQHSKDITAKFRGAGIRAEHLDAMTPTEERDAILHRLELGQTHIVSNCGILCKGWDQPSVKCAILARPTKSKALHRQQNGRVLRPYNGEQAIILDHCGNVRFLGRPEDEGEMTLEPRKRGRKGTSAPSCKTCECLAVIQSAARVCPMCGHQFSAASSERSAPEEREGELVQIPRSISAASDHRAQWDALVERWHRENRTRNVARQPGWIWHEFKQRTGASKIPDGCALPTLTEEQEAKLARFGELNRYAHANGWSKGRLHAVFAAQEKSS